jgi:hypothetical protein
MLLRAWQAVQTCTGRHFNLQDGTRQLGTPGRVKWPVLQKCSVSMVRVGCARSVPLQVSPTYLIQTRAAIKVGGTYTYSILLESSLTITYNVIQNEIRLASLINHSGPIRPVVVFFFFPGRGQQYVTGMGEYACVTRFIAVVHDFYPLPNF